MMAPGIEAAEHQAREHSGAKQALQQYRKEIVRLSAVVLDSALEKAQQPTPAAEEGGDPTPPELGSGQADIARKWVKGFFAKAISICEQGIAYQGNQEMIFKGKRQALDAVCEQIDKQIAIEKAREARRTEDEAERDASDDAVLADEINGKAKQIADELVAQSPHSARPSRANGTKKAAAKKRAAAGKSSSSRRPKK